MEDTSANVRCEIEDFVETEFLRLGNMGRPRVVRFGFGFGFVLPCLAPVGLVVFGDRFVVLIYLLFSPTQWEALRPATPGKRIQVPEV